MGKINTYQRKQLASSVTGVASQDQSGAIVGKAIGNLGAALTKRQDALDGAAASTAFYQYKAATNLAATKQQKLYQNDTNLDPTSYDEIYQQTASGIATEMKTSLPERIHGAFDVLVSKANAQQSIANNKWVFNQQNRNALVDFEELNKQAATLASDYMNSEDYLEGRDTYLETVEQYKPLTTAKSFTGTVNRGLKQQAEMYWANSIDFRNGGDPITFANQIQTNEKLRETLRSDMGDKQFRKLEKGLGDVLKAAGADAEFMATVNDSKELGDKVNKLWNPENNYGLAEVSAELEGAINKRNYVSSINKDGVYDGLLQQSEANIQNLQKLQRIAINVNDASYATDPAVKNELLAEIRVAMAPFKESKFKDKLAKVKQDIGNKLSKVDARIPWHHYLPIFPSAHREAFRGIYAKATGVPIGIRGEQAEKISAEKGVSQYIEAGQTMKGRVLDAIEGKKLTYKDGLDLINTIGLVSTVDKYDLLKTQGDNWFTAGFDNFSKYARGLNLLQGSTIENNRQFRDDVRTQMVERYSQLVAQNERSGVPMTPEIIEGLINRVKYEKNVQLHPEVMGIKVGGRFISQGGKVMEFGGFNPETGEIMAKEQGLQNALRNR